MFMNAIAKTVRMIRIRVEELHCLLYLLEDLEAEKLKSSNGAKGAGLQLSYLKEVTDGTENNKDWT